MNAFKTSAIIGILGLFLMGSAAAPANDRLMEISSDSLGQPTTYQWLFFAPLAGGVCAWQFEPQQNMVVTGLGHFHRPGRPPETMSEQILWAADGTRLGSCTPMHQAGAWNWCPLSPPRLVPRGEAYRISIVAYEYVAGINIPPNTRNVYFEGSYFGYVYDPLTGLGRPDSFPDTPVSANAIPLVDFRWLDPPVVRIR